MGTRMEKLIILETSSTFGVEDSRLSGGSSGRLVGLYVLGCELKVFALNVVVGVCCGKEESER